jgi:glutamate--cysteine ligase
MPILDYSSLKNYICSIARYIVNGDLKAASELYYPVRVKPRGANSLETLLQNGVNHLELRVLDVNPLTRTGIFPEDIRFIHLLLLWLSSLPDFDFDEEKQLQAIADVKAAAVFGNAEIKRRAKETLEEIKRFTRQYFPHFLPVINYQLNKLTDGNSYAEIVSRKFTDGYMEKGIALARRYQGGERSV